MAREGVFTTHQTITNTITRWQATGSAEDCPQIGQVKAILPAHYRFIDATIAENDELTASDLKMLLVKEFGEDKATYSKRTVARARNEVRWTFTTAGYCQAIRDANIQKRIEWVNRCLEDEEQFKDVIFTDECMVQLECHRRKSFRKTDVSRNLKYCHKHPPKVHVWAGISEQGATKLIMFSGIMTATRYGDISSVSLVPFLQKSYPNGHRLYQDNDLKHTSRFCTE